MSPLRKVEWCFHYKKADIMEQCAMDGMDPGKNGFYSLQQLMARPGLIGHSTDKEDFLRFHKAGLKACQLNQANLGSRL